MDDAAAPVEGASALVAPPREGASALVAPPRDGPPREASRLRRAARAALRPAVLWSVAAAIVVAGNAGMFALVSRWSIESASLEEQATGLGREVAASNASIATSEATKVLYRAQDAALRSRAEVVSGESEAEKARAEAFLKAVHGYQECADARATAISEAWAGRSDATAKATANAACARADADLAAAKAGG